MKGSQKRRRPDTIVAICQGEADAAHPRLSVDALAVSVVRTLVDELDRSGAGNRFAGAYATTTRVIAAATVEPYVFWKRDVNLRRELGVVGDLQHATVGARIAGRLPARPD